MDHKPPIISADAQGLREQNAHDEKRLLAAWDEIIAIGGANYNAGDRVLMSVEIDLSWDEFIEIFTNWPGFDELARSLPEYLPGLPADWLSRITGLTPGSGTEVWRRGAVICLKSQG